MGEEGKGKERESFEVDISSAEGKKNSEKMRSIPDVCARGLGNVTGLLTRACENSFFGFGRSRIVANFRVSVICLGFPLFFFIPGLRVGFDRNLNVGRRQSSRK